jgi:hypothetical protein
VQSPLCFFFTHDPFEHQASDPHAAFDAHEELHEPRPEAQLAGSQTRSIDLQEPNPSHSGDVSVPLLHAIAPQELPLAGNEQENDFPSQVPLQLDPSPAQLCPGAGAPVTGWQSPSQPGTAQEPQGSLHAEKQHTPSAQDR